MTHGKKKKREDGKEVMCQRLGQGSNLDLCDGLHMSSHSLKTPTKRWHGNSLPLYRTGHSDSFLMTGMGLK